ncbi:MAG: hypothetical protein ACREAB_19200, partial [Blastocatellia bacterium]
MKFLLRITQSLSLNAIVAFRMALIGAALWLAANAGSVAQAAPIIVNSAADGNSPTSPPWLPPPPPACTLRDAITAANTNQVVRGCAKGDPSPVVDTILFNLGAGTPTIRLTTMLPVITEPVTIQGDSGGATRVELDGSKASQNAAFSGARAHGLFLVIGDSTIRNLVINRFNGNGIVLTKNTGGGATSFTPPPITDPSNTNPPPCLARPAEPDCQPGGGGGDPSNPPPYDNTGANNKVIGCFIGTDGAGTIALGNGSGLLTAGIVTTTNSHTIGGPTAAERNVISGNIGHGIILGGNNHKVRGNFIGLDAGGLSPLGNLFDGINVANSLGFGAIGASIDSRGRLDCDSLPDVQCGNRIAFNARNGISGGFNFHTFLSNSIFSNGALGIDVGPFGLTPNSPGSSGNFPELSRV